MTSTAIAPGAPRAAQPAEPVPKGAHGIHLGKYVFLGVQLALLTVILRQFQIENNALLRLCLLAFAGFAVHYFLPFAWRMPFFSLLSVGGIALVFGAANTAWIVGFGLAMIGICHLPLGLAWRATMLGVFGGFLALCSVAVIPGPWSQAIWPILGAMFMFRLIVYVYDLRTEKVAPSFWRSTAYFFVLPNVCFTMFPVLDYKGFRRGYYDIERHRIYQIGVDWMTRGVVHLILYRIVYYHLSIPSAEVVDPDSLTRFVVSNFMLYLQISGTFHLITGMLHLFGFNVTETHHRFALSSSFTDFWRRINIYWKDFMLKIFYMPLYFRLKKLGPTKALVVATSVVFLATWMLHSYQWFWLRGDFPIHWQDAVFWTLLAVLVIFSSLREIERGRARSLSKTKESARDAVGRGLRTVGIFFFICVLWSLWTCDSWPSWIAMFDFVWRGVPEEGSWFPGYALVLAVVVFLGGVFLGKDNKGDGTAKGRAGLVRTPTTIATVATLAVVAPLGVPAVYQHLGTDLANGILSLRAAHLSRADQAKQEKGYYENLTRVNRFNSELWKLYMGKDVFHWLDVRAGGAGLTRLTGDFQKSELTPNMQAETPFGTIVTNSWGYRDREWSEAPAPGVFRIAVLGPSTVFGWGVAHEETFQVLLEDHLDAWRARAHGGEPRFEVLNFGVPGFRLPQELPMLDKALAFAPHAVFYVAFGRELERTAEFLAETVTDGVDIPYAELQAIIASADVTPDLDEPSAYKRLLGVEREIVEWIYGELARKCRARGVVPVWVFVPRLEDSQVSDEADVAEALARAAGFEIIDLDGVFDGYTEAELQVASHDDDHPNALGHRLLARRIFDIIAGSDGELRRAIDD